MKNKFLQFLSSMRRGAAMLIMLLTLGVGQMWAGNKRIYCKMEYGWWTADGAAVGAHYWGGATGTEWPGIRMTPLSGESNVWYIDVPDDHSNIVFVRVNGSGTIADWGAKTVDLSIGSTTNNFFTITNSSASWGDNKCNGTWSNKQLTSTASLSASSTSITTAQTSTLAPSLTSNTAYNAIKSTSYSVTTNPGSAGSVTSAGVFSATAAGTYTVTATVTYNALGFTSITKSATATKNITVSVPAETTHAVDITYKCGSTTVSTATKQTIGEVTTASVTAPTVAGYNFSSWTLGNGVADQGSDLTANPISVKTLGSGTYTMQANYTEDLSSPWTIKGGTNITGNNWSTAYNMTKKSGHSTESVVYYTFNISSTNNGVSGTADDWSFKVIKDGSTWYGLFASDSYWWKRGTSANQPLTGEQNIQICADVAGPYEIKVDYTTPASPKVTVTFPTSYTLTYSIGSVAGTSGSISTSPTTANGSKVLSGNSVTLTAPAAKTGYTWKGWYTNAAGTEGKIADTDRAITVTMSADKTLYACYTEDMHTVTVTTDGHGTITTPASGTPRTVSAGIATGASIATSANTGYTFYNWTKTSGSGTVTFTDANTASTTVKATSDATIQANFVDTWNLKGSEWSSWGEYKPMTSTGKANEYSTTLTLTKGTDYSFKVVKRNSSASVSWYGNENNAGDKAFTRGMSAFTTTAEGSNNNLKVTPDVTGDYIFTINTSGSTPVITVSYPTAYTVTYGAGTINGSNSAISVSPSFTSGDYVLPETDITFSKGTTKDGYTWKGWYSSEAGTGDAWSTTDANLSLTDARTGDIEVYACYNFVTYSITYNTNGGSITPTPASSFNVETPTITLPTPTRTGYTFNGWYANSDLSTGGVKTQIAKGTHEDQEFWAKWTANEYTITLKPNGGSGYDQSVTATFDDHAPDYDEGAKNYKFASITNPTKTGYNFEGWWTSSDAGTTLVTEIITKYKFYEWNTSYVNNSGLWQHDGDVTVYAKWTPNNYAVTLSTSGETGYGSSAPSNQTATYGTALPTITPPVGAPGYKFQGYFTSAGGAGTKYYNADGTSAANWNIAEATTLHAYFLEAEITSLVHETSVAKAEEAELVVNPVLNVVPENYIAICWTLHYADNNNPVDGEHWSVTSYTENGDKPYQVKYTFTNLASGSYYVKATLRKSASAFSNVCTDGTKMMDIHGDFHVAGNNTVTVRYLTTDFGSDFALKAPTEVEVEAMRTAEITAPEIPGYTFTRWSIGDGISTSDAVTANPITISATYDGVLTARYAKKQVVYFNNTLGWEDVYVYFYNDASGNQYWANNYGTGANKQQTFGGNKPYWEQHHGHMTQIEGTNIWYFDFKAADYPTRTKVAFANVEQSIDKSGASDDEAYFHNASVVYRTDFDASHLPMFVPINSVEYDYTTNTGSKYYRGYWMNYPESTGYELRFYNKRANDGTAPYELVSKRHKFEFTGDKTLPMSVSLDLEAGHDYYFKIYRVDGTYYGNNNQMTNGHSGDEGQPAWEFKTGTENAWVTASGAGNYTFTLTYGIDLSSNYNYLVGVRYPESTGDFRVLYSDAVRVSTHESDEGKSWLASYVIPKTSESDTVSFFVRKASTPKIKAQKCTATYDEGTGTTTVTWADENGGADLLPDTISADGVYNFIFTKSGDNLVLSAVEPYTGNFYIRVDGAGTSNWDNFRASDHLMPYSDYSFQQEDNPYSHYFTQWYEPNPEGKSVDPKNIKFVVANDYSACVSDTIVRDGIADNYVDENGWLSGRNANIRFMYNYKTNVASRRYIDGAQEDGSEFLLLIPEDDDMIFDAETEGTAYTQVTFTDKGNWIYEANVWVVPGTDYKLRSKFGDGDNIITQYFKGDEDTYEKLIEGSGSSRLQIRLLYDFKTNRLVSAYIPSSTISGNLVINADVMFIREGQGEMQQLTFENNATLSAITNVYSVLRFNKWTLNNRYTDGGHGLILDPKSIYERSLYFVSFPFDVKLSDVFGFGTYWDEWYIEYYDGAARAKNGFWIDSDSYWKYVTPAMKDTFTLKAGQGYIFGLDLDYLHCEGEGEGQQANVWKNIQTADFIFPGNVSSISNSSVTYTLPAHTCTINRGTACGNRTIADSHWNVLGVPTYLNTTSVTFEETTGDWMTDGKPKYIYSWNPQDNSLSPTSAADFTYHSMNAYVVQYYGNVTFSTSVSPIAAPRRNPEYRGEYEFRLEIQQNEQAIDHTFIRLTDDEEATVNFEFGLDLTKSINANKANIYTIVEGYLQAAGNCLPLTDQTTVVPVGVIAKTTGDYTFSIPEGTEGVGVTLIDNETGIRTSLSALDYTINLNAGTYDNRFILEISPVRPISTDLEDVTGDESQVTGARKVLIDGLLYIVKDGKIFDAQGKRLQ